MIHTIISSIIILALSLIKAELSFSELNRPLVSKTIHHALDVVISPHESQLTVVDSISLPDDFPSDFTFFLHKNMNPRSHTPGVTITSLTNNPGSSVYESFSVKMPSGTRRLTIEYRGKLYHPIQKQGKEYARSIQQTPGIISHEGIYLSGISFWYPHIDNKMLSFDMMVELPDGWSAVAQGERSLNLKKTNKTKIRWESNEPQDEIYLVGGKFFEYTKKEGNILAMACLRSPDSVLAEKYLNATFRYIAMYSKLIGPYPYKKFAVVENFWETGFGMPSFTLLGPKVIRFPFIINSSYPHEILHTWWGNSVFPDYTKGNWSEGLTAYLADHLLKEQIGKDLEHRLTTLQKYTDYVREEKDFPLSDFHMRHSASSEAVGYGKSLMIFHMLRQELGDHIFKDGLREFYRKYRYRFASFDDLRRSFERVSRKNLASFFKQWISRPGAPLIRLKGVRTQKTGTGHTITGTIEQAQNGIPYSLSIPIAVTLEGHENAYHDKVYVNARETNFQISVESIPRRLDLDPEFDVFRELDLEEVPPALSQLLGSQKIVIILPSSSQSILLKKYKALGEVLRLSGPDKVEILYDNDIHSFPSDTAVVVLGWGNKFKERIFSTIPSNHLKQEGEKLYIMNTEISKEQNTVVLTSRNPHDKGISYGFIATDNPAAISGIGRKLPHYHKYSYLLFTGEEPENILKGRWPVISSPMTVYFPDKNGKISVIKAGSLKKRSPLTTLPAVFSSKNMIETIKFLTNERLAGRGFNSTGLEESAEYIMQQYRKFGLKPYDASHNSYVQEWTDHEHGTRMQNIIGIIPGTNTSFKGQSVVVGAHYDHLGFGWPDVRNGNKGKIHPGADDNASGVAVLIELARFFSQQENPERSIVFIAFTGEESGRKGSLYYVQKSILFPPERAIGMINLDTVGCMKDNSVFVLGTESAEEWIHILRGGGYVSGVETNFVTEQLDASDHVSFHEAGIPAVQIFTGPHDDYHRPSDTIDKINHEGLMKVALLSKEVVEHLSVRNDFLTFSLQPADQMVDPNKYARKIGLGVIPDFAHDGFGCKISGVLENSPAENAGLRKGDIIVGIDSNSIENLKGLSNILKTLQPGDTITIVFYRNDMKHETTTKVIEK
jgi:aminopeptidase N